MLEQFVQNAMYNAAQEMQVTATDQRQPHVLLRPRIFPDGNAWCALYGEDLQHGVAGFGDTPAAAAADFDRNWNTQKAGPTPGVAPAPAPAESCVTSLGFCKKHPACVPLCDAALGVPVGYDPERIAADIETLRERIRSGDTSDIDAEMLALARAARGVEVLDADPKAPSTTDGGQP